MPQLNAASDRERALALLAGRTASGRAFFETASHALALGAGCKRLPKVAIGMIMF